MANIIDNLETDAKSFMAKNLRKENQTKMDMIRILNRTQKEIERLFTSLSSVNIYNMGSILSSEVQPIINRANSDMNFIINGVINDNYNVGLETGEKFIQITGEKKTVLDKYRDGNAEVLLALLLFGKKLIDGLSNDLYSMLDKNLTNIFIESKNAKNPSFSNENRNTDSNTTINTILPGKTINKYISPTFKNISTRAETISQTETNRSLNHGILLAYIAAKKEIPDLYVKWVEIRDGRLCRYCKERAESGDIGLGVYNINSITPPPLHARCRCVLIPYSPRWV